MSLVTYYICKVCPISSCPKQLLQSAEMSDITKMACAFRTDMLY